MNEQTQEACAKETESLICTKTTSQHADVSVPIKIKPYASVGKLAVGCCGEPVALLHPCQGASAACGCEFTITQTVCISIPIQYGAEADIGAATVLCRRAPNGLSGPCGK